MSDTDNLLRELHHRVKNNFQIIASLLSLQKRVLPPERRADLRFIEEHVQAMAIAHQTMYAAPELTSVPVHALVGDVLDSLQQIAGSRETLLAPDLVIVDHAVGLNQSIALCLYLAVVVPPFIDRGMLIDNATVRITLTLDEPYFTLTIAGDWADPIEFDLLRSRLAEAYIRQLEAEPITDASLPVHGIRFALLADGGQSSSAG